MQATTVNPTFRRYQKLQRLRIQRQQLAYMKAAFHTLGCKTNAYETQAVREQFEQRGFQIVDFSEPADVYVVNTCSVTAVAAQKSRQMLHRCKKLSPECLVVACGCYAQEAAEKLLEDQYVDLVVGNNEKSRIAALVLEILQEKAGTLVPDALQAKPAPLVLDDLSGCKEYETQTITNAGSHVRAYVKIQDGCDRFCSYCIIPYLRGRSRSRAPEEILSEVRTLTGNGIQEIVLTGIDISDFHTDANRKDAGIALADLLLSIEEIEGVQRIRLGSLEAGILTEPFIQAVQKSRKLCPHFHLSLQSGCDETLKRMNRHYTTAEFADVVRSLRQAFPDPAVTTDLIAGFPGETEEEFEITKDFIRQIGFAQMHVFPYSRRKGTRADRMEGQLTGAEKAKRTAELIAIGKELQTAYMKRFIGKPVHLLPEEIVQIHEKKYLIGFTPAYVRAVVPAETGKINNIVTMCPSRILSLRNESVLQ